MSITVVNIRKEKADIYIGRGSMWGNPFVIGRDGDRTTVIAKHRAWLLARPQDLAMLHVLKGKRIGCYCAPLPCHGDTLKELCGD